MKISWWKLWKDRRAEKKYAARLALFHELLGNKESGVPAMVDGLAMTKAVEIVRKFYSARGIAHCAFCLSTEQLRKHGKGYLCPTHKTAMDKAATQRTVASQAAT